ncbi:uncharacterized protein LOC133795996 [Humulus lupulus]|uniref:uncharacterized protein LOC133795996 n=1 Tax=Humulus lupulus TaxID=3486 RepID=UPI002B401A5E|nr:uncharacterized protein LOC133795996 [Humulus lupulus]
MRKGSRLVDISASGRKFTWRKKCKELGGLSTLKRVRLDRCFANLDCRISFSKATLQNLITSSFYHNPILLDTLVDNEKLRKPFKYENMWAHNINYFWIIKRTWMSTYHNDQMRSFAQKQRATKKDLLKWDRLHFQSIQEQIHKAKTALKQAESTYPDNLENELEVRNTLNEVL